VHKFLFLLQHMTDETEARAAVADLNRFNLYGSQLRVEVCVKIFLDSTLVV
jgi:hypothetical protein